MKAKQTLRTFLLLTFAEGVLTLILLLTIPGDPKNAWILGLSRFRVLMLAAGMFVVGTTGLFVRRTVNDRTRLTHLQEKVSSALSWDGHVTTTLTLALAGLIAGSYFFYITFTSTDQFLLGFFRRLTPWVFWVTAICAQTLVLLIQALRQGSRSYFRAHWLALFTLLVVLITGVAIHTSLWELRPEDWDVRHIFNQDNKFELTQQDIFAVYTEGDRLSRGINPYARVLEQGGDMRWNLTFPAYLPVMYSLSALIEGIGVTDFLDYLSVLRWFYLAANLGIAYLLFYVPYHRYNALLFGAFSALFWLMNRWVVHITMIYHFDFLALLPFLISLALWPRHRRLSLLLFGLSLAVKHMAIFMAPVYLVWIARTTEKPSLRRLVEGALWMGAVPLLVALPFMVWNLEGFFKSLLISLTRVAESHFGVPDFATVFTLSGASAKLPMFGLFLLIYGLAWRNRLRPFAAGLFVMAVFLDYNAVLFRQYMVWIVPLIPLAAAGTLAPLIARQTPDQPPREENNAL